MTHTQYFETLKPVYGSCGNALLPTDGVIQRTAGVSALRNDRSVKASALAQRTPSVFTLDGYRVMASRRRNRAK